MKTSTLIVLSAVVATAATSQAQNSTERQLERKYFAPNAPSGVTLRTIKTAKGEPTIYLAASKATAAQVLRHIAVVTGERLITAPALQNGEVKTWSTIRDSPEELIKSVVSLYQIQSVEIAPGVRLFAPLPIESAGQWAYKDRLASKVRGEQLADYNRQVQREKNEADARANRGEWEKLRADPRYDPFVAPNGGLNPDYQPPKPQPGWDKREFNGHEFYYVPAPTEPRSR